MGGSESKPKEGCHVSTAAPTPAANGAAAPAGGEKKLKPCCACPETKRARDECILLNGEEQCGELIEAHKRCMREAGFQI